MRQLWGKHAEIGKYCVILKARFVSQVFCSTPLVLEVFQAFLVIPPFIASRKHMGASSSYCVTNVKGPDSEVITWKVKMKMFAFSHSMKTEWRNNTLLTFTIKVRDVLLYMGK